MKSQVKVMDGIKNAEDRETCIDRGAQPTEGR